MADTEHRLQYGGTPLDFTTWRVGRKWRGNPIAVCPKCGRKGVQQQIELTVGRPVWHYVHWAEVAGAVFIRDFCSAPAPGHPNYQEPEAPHAQ